jgi:putative flippase GtrA
MKIARQFVKYGTAALLSAASDWLVFAAVLAVFGWPIPAQASSRIVGGVVSFGVNKYWSFESRSHERMLAEARRFLVLFVISYIVSLSLFSALTYAGVWPYWAKLMTDMSCFFFNFFMMRFWVYRAQASVTEVCLPPVHSTGTLRGSDNGTILRPFARGDKHC